MSQSPRSIRILAGAMTGLALALGIGCAEELGPVPMPVAHIRGVVTEGERPVAGGWIEFIPTDGTIGNLRSARLGPDGTFDADGVAVGTNAIRLVNARIERAGLRDLFSAFGSPIRRVIGPDHPASLTINLVEEAARFQRERERLMAGDSRPAGGGP